MRLALTAAYAVVSLAHRLHSTVVTYQETPLESLEMLLLATLRDITRIDTVIVMPEDSRDVDTIWTWHAVCAARTWNSRVVLHEIRHLLQE